VGPRSHPADDRPARCRFGPILPAENLGSGLLGAAQANDRSLDTLKTRFFFLNVLAEDLPVRKNTATDLDGALPYRHPASRHQAL